MIRYFFGRNTIKAIFFAVICCMFLGCFDVFRENQEKIVGNISVINPHNEEDKGYRMVLYEKEFNSNVLNDYVTNVIGNDTVLFARCFTKSDCNEIYYKIEHNKGNKPIKVISIDKNSYIQFTATFESPKYKFTDNSSDICNN